MGIKQIHVCDWCGKEQDQAKPKHWTEEYVNIHIQCELGAGANKGTVAKAFLCWNCQKTLYDSLVGAAVAAKSRCCTTGVEG